MIALIKLRKIYDFGKNALQEKREKLKNFLSKNSHICKLGKRSFVKENLFLKNFFSHFHCILFSTRGKKLSCRARERCLYRNGDNAIGTERKKNL